MAKFNVQKFWRLFLLISVLDKKTIVKAGDQTMSLPDIMLTDIESAFKVVVNTTNLGGPNILRDRIIPQMYNNIRSSTFLFKIPDAKSNLGYKMITAERSELMKPIFPNLTIMAKETMLKTRQLGAAVRFTEDMIKAKKNEELNDEWSSLGLSGWTGEIVNVTDILELTHKDEYISTGNKEFDSAENGTIDDISKNIYIGRVNDVFGFSTKWSYRNDTKSTANLTDERYKRDIVELYSMIKCATGCEPLKYQSYGCFCGFLGNGIAVDSIDNCCRMHDKCYEHSNCLSYLHYFVPYLWKCYRGKPVCALDHGGYGGPTSCAALLCYCDFRLSLCLRKFQCPQRKATCTTSLARKLQNLFL